MDSLDYSPKPKSIHPAASIAILIALFIVNLIIGQTVALLVVKVVYGYSIEALKDFISNPQEYPNSRMAFLLNHAVGTVIFSFVVTAYIWKKFIEKDAFSSFFKVGENNNLLIIGLGAAITMLSNPLNSVFISLNKDLVLPAGFESIENKMKAMEQSAEVLVKFLTDFQTPIEMLMAVVVMGALTGIGEEVFFRGALQSKLNVVFKNPHIAIWVASFIFSFVHFQFYGFVPRMLLAALFGYMYYWSGNLWVPIVAHAVNNGSTVLALYFTKDSDFGKELVESNEMMPLPAVLISAIATIGLLYYFHKITKHDKSDNLTTE